MKPFDCQNDQSQIVDALLTLAFETYWQSFGTQLLAWHSYHHLRQPIYRLMVLSCASKSMEASQFPSYQYWHHGSDKGRSSVAFRRFQPVCYSIQIHQVIWDIHQQNVFKSQEASRSVWEDVECKLKCVNFRRVSDPRRIFLLALRVTRSAGDKPGSSGDMSGCTSNHSRAVWEKHLLWERCWYAWKSQLLLIVHRFLKLMKSVCILIYVSM